MKARVSALLVGLAVTAVALSFGRRDEVSEIQQQMGKLRSMDDHQRAGVTKDLAIRIRKLPADEMRMNLAYSLSNLATEGDFGPGTLQDVTTTLNVSADAVTSGRMLPSVYDQLAALSKYEHMKVKSPANEYKLAIERLEKLDAARAKVDFNLVDLAGKAWHLSDLKDKVVLVNFWATWCPPCRKEMPDLNALYDEFKDQGFVILAISDEKTETIQKFITDKGYTYPILLDPTKVVAQSYGVLGIPKSFLYGRNGKLIGQTIDMRTKEQFYKLLATAGLKHK